MNPAAAPDLPALPAATSSVPMAARFAALLLSRQDRLLSVAGSMVIPPAQKAFWHRAARMNGGKARQLGR